MKRDAMKVHFVMSIAAMLAVSVALSGCAKNSAPPRGSAQAPPADTASAQTVSPAPRPEYGSNAASDAISERARAAEPRPQPASAPESTSASESSTATQDDSPQAESPTSGDAGAQDSTIHHQVVPRKSRRPGGH
jgi:hypothetical protein